MSKIEFPKELGYGRQRIDVAIANNPNYSERSHNAEDLSQLVGKFTESEFFAAGLSRHMPERYRTAQSVDERSAAFGRSVNSRRPTAAYLIKDLQANIIPNEPASQIIGMLAFGRDDTEPRYRESGERVFSSWFHGSLAVDVNPEKVVASGVEIAKEAGLRAIKLIIVKEKMDIRNYDLVVAEHHIKPAQLGFKQVANDTTVIEGEKFEGAVWRRDIF